jgi:parallel beta-helix repeat protein
MRIARARLLVLVVVGGGGLCLGASSAAARPAAIQCGATLTHSTVLTADLVGCTGSGLIIGADGITVDLAGHLIAGTNTPGGEGIADDGHAGVRILRGRISDFRLNGVGLRNAPGSVVRGLVIRRIGAGGTEGEPVSAGIALVGSPGSQLSANDVANDVTAYQSDGADVLRSPNTTVLGNRLTHNAWDGLVVIGSPSSQVVGNQLDVNGNNGVEVNGQSDATRVVANRADRNGFLGIVVGDVRDAIVLGNSARGNDTGLFFFDLHTSLISGNSASGNRDGLDLNGGQYGSSGNRLIGNVTNQNSETGLGLAGDANDNLVSHNVANGNLGAIGEGGGIYVAASTGNQLISNTANANADNGIVFYEDTPGDTSGNTLTGNSTNGNANHGIAATAGSIDGGGNRASGNAVAPACLNVACTG